MAEQKMIHDTEINRTEETEREDFRVETSLRIDDIVAFQTVKERLKKILNGQQYSGFLKNAGADVPHGVLLYGPKGCGKTFMAEAFVGSLADQTGRTIFQYSGDLCDETDLARLRVLKDCILESEKSILILDNLEKLVSEENEKKNMLTFLECIRDCDVFFVVTCREGTKDDEDIRDALALSELIDIEYPTPGEIMLIIDYICNSFGFPWNFLSESERKCGGTLLQKFSDAAALCFEESFVTLKKMLSVALYHALTEEKSQMDIQDLIYGVDRSRYAFCDESQKLEQIELKESAYHEAGHILAREILKPGSAGYASIVRQGRTEGREGYLHVLENLDKKEDTVVCLLASKAAVEMVLGNAVNIGCVGDITQALDVIKKMVLYRGQYGLEYSELYDDFEKAAPDTRRKIDEKIYAVAVQQYEKARSILCEHRRQLDQLADKLLRDGYILASEIQLICHSNTSYKIIADLRNNDVSCA